MCVHTLLDSQYCQILHWFESNSSWKDTDHGIIVHSVLYQILRYMSLNIVYNEIINQVIGCCMQSTFGQVREIIHVIMICIKIPLYDDTVFDSFMKILEHCAHMLNSANVLLYDKTRQEQWWINASVWPELSATISIIDHVDGLLAWPKVYASVILVKAFPGCKMHNNNYFL